MRVDNETNSAAYTFDYVEPQTVWECMDAVFHYVTALWSIRTEDYSGLVLLRALHDVRYFGFFVFSRSFFLSGIFLTTLVWARGFTPLTSKNVLFNGSQNPNALTSA